MSGKSQLSRLGDNCSITWFISFSYNAYTLGSLICAEVSKENEAHLKPSNGVDETYIKIKGAWKYLYHAVDSDGNTLEWMLSAKRDKKAAKRFFKKISANNHCRSTRAINTDKAKAVPPAFVAAKNENIIPETTKHRRQKYLNNIQVQDHRSSKRRVRQRQWFQSFHTAK